MQPLTKHMEKDFVTSEIAMIKFLLRRSFQGSVRFSSLFPAKTQRTPGIFFEILEAFAGYILQKP